MSPYNSGDLTGLFLTDDRVAMTIESYHVQLALAFAQADQPDPAHDDSHPREPTHPL